MSVFLFNIYFWEPTMCQVLFGAGYSAMNKTKTGKYPTPMKPGVTGSSCPILISPVLSTHPGSLQTFEQTWNAFPFSHLIFSFLHISDSSWWDTCNWTDTHVFMVWDPWTRWNTLWWDLLHFQSSFWICCLLSYFWQDLSSGVVHWALVHGFAFHDLEQ